LPDVIMMRFWRGFTFLLALFACQVSGVDSARASSIDGTWNIRDLVLDIYDCGSAVCGRIVGVRDPIRRPKQCGMIIVWGLTQEGPSEWGNGRILDPDDGTIYRLSATFEPDGTLRARIYELVPLLGRTQILRRINLWSFSGRC
jgi:uncharacterized protein (DUF2147 family)